jgi:protein-L-isoaspartate O-methyltransferase
VFGGRRQCPVRIVLDASPVPHGLQQQLKELGRILVVVDDQHVDGPGKTRRDRRVACRKVSFTATIVGSSLGESRYSPIGERSNTDW